jgi:hypothetical protein
VVSLYLEEVSTVDPTLPCTVLTSSNNKVKK